MKSPVFWYQAARQNALPQSFIPAVLTVVLCLFEPGFLVVPGLVGVLGVLALHLSMNLFDDYFDWKVGSAHTRADLDRKGIRARMGKCRYLSSGEVTVKELRTAALTFLALGALAAGVVFWFRGPWTAAFVVAVGLLGFSYSAGPLKLSYRGLGEPAVGLTFGPLLMAGVAWASCGAVPSRVLVLSIPVGLSVAAILFVHSIMDAEPDRSVGKVTLAVLLGTPDRMLATLAVLLTAGYLVVAGAVALGFLEPWFLFVCVLALPSRVLYRSMGQFLEAPQKDVRARWWMGPMANRERNRNLGIEWFMVRWYLSRNILVALCLLALALSFIPRLFPGGGWA